MRKTADQIRSEITAQVVAAIQKGCPPWRQPWLNHPNSGASRNAASGRRYTGINPMILAIVSEFCHYKSRLWNTSSSWMKSIGVHVKKGETAAMVTLFRMVPKKENGVEVVVNGKKAMFPLLRQYPLFNAEQMTAPSVEMLLKYHYPFDRSKKGSPTKESLLECANRFLPASKMPSPRSSKEKIAEAIHVGIDSRLDDFKVKEVIVNSDPDFEPAEEVILKCGIKVKANEESAFYRPKPNEMIGLPSKRSFLSMSDYYQTAMHEIIHMVVNGKRIDVDDKRLTYAFGELVAEIGSCFVLNALNVPCADKMLDKSKMYLDHWLKEMGGDSKYIFDASSIASRAADYVLSLVGKANPSYDDSEGSDDSDDHERAA